MTHEQALERLDDFACGELPDIDRMRVQRHVETCDECRAEVQAVQALLAQAAALPLAVAPPVDLWAAIAPRLEPRAAPLHLMERTAEAPAAGTAAQETKVIPLAPRRGGWQAPRWALQLAAALLLVAGSSAITARIVREQARQPAGPVALGPATANPPQQEIRATVSEPAQAGAQAGPAPATRGQAAPATTAFAAFDAAEADYETAIADLERVLASRQGRMLPETAQALERNLRIIDAAIAESRAALERDPNSRELIQMLSATYDAKVKVLRQAVEI